MKKTTLCYIMRDGHCLMLYRNKKKNDDNEGKWVGIGGKFEEGETADECVLREVREETGFVLTDYVFLGVIEFRNDSCEDEDMYLYMARDFTDTAPESGARLPVPACSEGELKWIPAEELMDLNMWEGDRCFLKPMLAGERSINMRLVYSGDRLVGIVKLPPSVS